MPNVGAARASATTGMMLARICQTFFLLLWESVMSSKPRTGGHAAKRSDAKGTNPGVRTDRRADELKSRSADPGQSSYGGFRNEDPGAQHQATSGSSKKRTTKEG